MNWTATTTGVVTRIPDTEPLTAHDRCDRCGAQAYVSVLLHGTDTWLLFCGHHYAANADALHRVALVIRDERARLRTDL